MAATIKEVARRARVSVGTVSNVISGTVGVSQVLRERVLTAVRELDYHPNHVARSLKIRQTNMLGMVISDITNPFFPQLVRGAEDAAWKHNYVLMTFNSDDQPEREKQIFSVLRKRNVDGMLLVVAADEGDLPHVRQAMAQAPIVCLDRTPHGIECDSVTVDNAGGVRACIAHLIEQGHRRIGLLTGARSLETGRERLRGYVEALESAGIPLDPALIRSGDFRIEAGYREGKALLELKPRPTAVFGCNGVMTLGLLQSLGDLDLQCPRDVAVATFDDLPMLGSIRPRLTAVAQPSYDIGFQGAEMLIRRIQGQPGLQKLMLPTRLIVRESSAKPCSE
ncbi:MAG TPA: LacI family DNA-binding transcriptional regulator [Bryobacteraceae bacterium]|nr:LacI family DNA-binding transcriptional regulator [Bryobacteraceae bacterium]